MRAFKTANADLSPMGFMDSITGAGQDDNDEDAEGIQAEEDREIVAYEVTHSPPGDRGGWSAVDGYEDLSFPMSEREFRYNEEPLEPGRYTLFGLDQNHRRMMPDEENSWRIKVEDDSGGSSSASSAADDVADQVDRRLRKLEGKLEQIAESGQQQGKSPEVVQAEMKAAATRMALQNPHFMAAHGDKIALAAFDALPSQEEEGPGFDEWSDSPMQATFYKLSETLFDEPHKMEEIGKSMGTGFGGLLDGMAQGVAQSGEETDDGQEADEAEAWSLDDVDAGPTTLADLEESAGDEAEDVGDELEELVVEKETAGMEAETEPEEAEGQATFDDSPPMTAGPTNEDMAAVTESEVQASPEVADRATGQDLDPELCQHVKDDDSQCGNPPQEGSRFCHVESHGPAEPDEEPQEPEEPTEAPEPGTDSMDPETPPDEPSAAADEGGESDDEEPDPSEVADVL